MAIAVGQKSPRGRGGWALPHTLLPAPAVPTPWAGPKYHENYEEQVLVPPLLVFDPSCGMFLITVGNMLFTRSEMKPLFWLQLCRRQTYSTSQPTVRSSVL